MSKGFKANILATAIRYSITDETNNKQAKSLGRKRLGEEILGE